MSDAYSSLIQRLRQRFPTLQPIESAPPIFLFRQGGFTYASKKHDLGLQPPALPVGSGLGLIGKREVESQSGTYIKTRVLCFSSIPILFLGAYRVLDWERGLKQASDPNDRNETAAIVRHCQLIGPWYVIGKEPLSMPATVWNVAVIAFVFVLVFALSF